MIEIANADDFSGEGESAHPYTKSLYKALPHNGFELTGTSAICMERFLSDVLIMTDAPIN